MKKRIAALIIVLLLTIAGAIYKYNKNKTYTAEIEIPQYGYCENDFCGSHFFVWAAQLRRSNFATEPSCVSI